MAEIIQAIFITPPIVIARLGGSTTPQEAFKWVDTPNPRGEGETTIAPDWSLTVQADGSVEPFMPEALRFRDGALIRPVCPFLELRALMGEPGSAPATWREELLTPTLLSAHGATLNDLVFQIDARNLKAARRTANPAVGFGTFPPLQVRASDNTQTPILAVSPPTGTAADRMIPPGRNIPLGSFQVMRSRQQPASGSVDWAEAVRVDVIRCRFTPARGLVYGPPQTAQPVTLDEGTFVPVSANRAFLNPNAGWAGFPIGRAIDAPPDTYDGAENRPARLSLGVVDDTCEARIEVNLRLPGPPNRTLTAAANVFVGPPDYAPDRRPFLSLADELNDRAADVAARTNNMSAEDRDTWVEDLFERIYETTSLLNLDRQRNNRAITLTGDQLRPAAIPNDRTTEPTKAMGGRDRLREPLFPQPAPGPNIRLPLTEHAQMRHRALSDLDALRGFVAQHPGRLATLVRKPFESAQGESPEGIGITNMQMPPFMRNSNAGPLTLAAWQYDLLMAWVRSIENPPPPPPFLPLADAEPAPKPMSEAAAARRAEVLARIAAEDQQ
ncbi:MAG TPA: hypothetical protein VIQ24_20165 [Pyrinomonadaceae bacterium]